MQKPVQKISVLFLLITIFLTGCFSATPFQSARVAETDESSLTASLMHSSQDFGSVSNGWTQIDFVARQPFVGGQFEFSVNGGVMVFDHSGIGALLGSGLKVELLNDILAFELPAQFVVGGSNPVDTTFFYPRLIGSVPLSDKVELNLSATRYYYAQGNYDGPSGYAVGLAFGKRGDMIIRPEFGILVDQHSEEKTYQFGIGITPGISKKHSDRERDSDYESTPF